MIVLLLFAGILVLALLLAAWPGLVQMGRRDARTVVRHPRHRDDTRPTRTPIRGAR